MKLHEKAFFTDTKMENENPNQKLIDHIQIQIDKLSLRLECPVCLEVAKEPIFQCVDGHLICQNCRPKINACPTCRIKYVGKFNWKRHRHAEQDAEDLEDLFKQIVELGDSGTAHRDVVKAASEGDVRVLDETSGGLERVIG